MSSFLRVVTRTLLLLGCLGFAAACSSKPTTADEILQNIDKHLGKHVKFETKFRIVTRCGLDTPDGKWKTYCGDCQRCVGLYIVASDLHDVPTIVVGGTWNFRPIGCKGPLNQISCQPFEENQTYLVDGFIEKTNPPKLFIDKFKEI